MKKLAKINLLIFVLLILLPHSVRIYYSKLVSSETLSILQYLSLIISFIGGFFIIFYSSKSRNKSVSNVLSTLFIILGSMVSLLSVFMIFLIYSLRGGIGF